MAPNVRVPMNFGRHHIGSRSHSNLILKLKEGKELRTSSLILSFNSPVIDNLTTELEQTSLDMDDFEEPAIQCFIVASYVGELEDINKDIFREVNKMAHVFDVAWLVERCGEYFKGLNETVSGKTHEELLYLFEEARFVLESLKKRDLIEVVFRKLNQINGKKIFVKKYLEDLNNLTTKQLDLMLDLAGNDVDIVVQPLTSYLAEFPNVQNDVFTGNSMYLLENVHLSICRQSDRLLYENLFDILQGVENISNENLKFLFKLRRESDQDKRCCLVNVSRPVHRVTRNSTRIPNLFNSFDEFKDLLIFDELMSALAESVKVINMMMFAEGLFSWLFNNKSRSCTWSSTIMDKILTIKKERNWCSIPKQYFKFYTSAYKNIKQFFDGFMNCDELFDPIDDGHVTQVIDCHHPLRVTSREMFERENTFTFLFKHPGAPICTREGACGFIIKTTPLENDNPDTFDVRLCTDHAQYPANVHFHDDMLCVDNMHVMLGGYYSLGKETKQWYTNPVSWKGRPTNISTIRFKEGTSSILKWTWGLCDYSDNITINLKVLYCTNYEYDL